MGKPVNKNYAKKKNRNTNANGVGIKNALVDGRTHRT